MLVRIKGLFASRSRFDCKKDRISREFVYQRSQRRDNRVNLAQSNFVSVLFPVCSFFHFFLPFPLYLNAIKHSRIIILSAAMNAINLNAQWNEDIKARYGKKGQDINDKKRRRNSDGSSIILSSYRHQTFFLIYISFRNVRAIPSSDS